MSTSIIKPAVKHKSIRIHKSTTTNKTRSNIKITTAKALTPEERKIIDIKMSQINAESVLRQ